METTILLSRVLGLYIFIFGIIMMLRREYFIPLISTYVKEGLTRLIMSVIELLAGLFLIVIHNDYSTVPAAIITIFGWMAVVESILYLTAPDKTIRKFIQRFNTPAFYLIGGMVSTVLGAYLANYGFGWF